MAHGLGLRGAPRLIRRSAAGAPSRSPRIKSTNVVIARGRQGGAGQGKAMERESNMRYAAGEASREPDTPTGISIGLGCVVVVAAALVAALVPASAGGVRLGVLAVALAGFAAVAVDPSAAAFVTVTGFLVFDGFL